MNTNLNTVYMPYSPIQQQEIVVETTQTNNSAMLTTTEKAKKFNYKLPVGICISSAGLAGLIAGVTLLGVMKDHPSHNTAMVITGILLTVFGLSCVLVGGLTANGFKSCQNTNDEDDIQLTTIEDPPPEAPATAPVNYHLMSFNNQTGQWESIGNTSTGTSFFQSYAIQPMYATQDPSMYATQAPWASNPFSSLAPLYTHSQATNRL